MPSPIFPWETPDDEARGGLLVWRAKFDNRYLIEVQRHDPSSRLANLVIWDHEREDSEIACWEVGLSYGAVFGPDIDDVMTWQDKVADFVDNHYAYRSQQNG